MQRFSPATTAASDDHSSAAKPPSASNPPPLAATGSPIASPSSKNQKRHKQQPRQLMSCTKCRERKVKCDRTKPCSACCARGHPKDCHFVAGEGNFVPMQQSAELRRLRAENQRLKERLLEAKVSVSGDSDDGAPSTGQSSAFTRFGQRKFGADEPGETIYFGSPSFASVQADLQNAEADTSIKSLSHPPAGVYEIFAGSGPSVYPFPTIWTTSTWIQGLYTCLEPWQDVAELLVSFNERGTSALIPKPALSLTLADVQSFVADFGNNATTYPDSLALIFAMLACEMKRREYDPPGDRSEATISDAEAELRRNMFVSASMQALRQSSFACQPTLLSIQAMILIGTYLANDGKALDAWTVLGSTIRMAQAIGLHRNPKALDPIPSQRECSIRKKLWWQLLYTDQQYSMALGRPLGISAIGDCPFAEPLTTDAAMIRLTKCVEEITILGRQLLGTAPLQVHRVSSFAEKLQTLLDTIPEDIQFDRSWISDTSQIPEAPLDEYSAVIHLQVHSYLLLLHRQRLEPGQISNSGSEHSQNQSGDFLLARSSDPSNQRALASIAESCEHVLDVFEYLFKRRPSILVDWTVKQQALTAAVVLLQDFQHVSDTQHVESVETTSMIFQHLAQIRADTMSRFAVGRLNDGISRLREAQLQRRRSSIGAIPLPDFYSGSGAMRRDSQISWSSAARPAPAGYEQDLYSKSPVKQEEPANVEMVVQQRQQQPLPVAYHALSEASQPRRATVTGAMYPSVKVEVPPRPTTDFPDPGHFFHPQTGMVQAQGSPHIPQHGAPTHTPVAMSQYQFTNTQFQQPQHFASGQPGQMYLTNPHNDAQMFDMPVGYPQGQQHAQQQQRHHQQQHQVVAQHSQSQAPHHYFQATFPPPGMPSEVNHEVSDPKVSSASASFPTHAHHWGAGT